MKLEELERRVQMLEDELAALRELVAPGLEEPRVEPQAPSIDEAIRFVDTPAAPPAPPRPRASSAPAEARKPPESPRPPLLPELSFADLLGAKALAIAGGIVTLLGIIFFFILAVNRGWIGPGGRVAMGAVAAVGVYGAGLWLHRRYGETHSSLAAVAAGLAGGYATLLAATELYDFVGKPVALVIAAAIAAIGLVTALRWNSQIVAGIGLLGAMLAPLAIAIQGGISVAGTWFVMLMAVATATVAVWKRWNTLLVLGAIAGLAQALALVLQPEYRGRSPAEIVALAAVFAAITVGTGVAVQLRERTADLGTLVTSFLFVGASFAVLSMLRLYGSTESRGVALLAVAVGFGALAAILLQRERDLSPLLGALGLVVGGIAFGQLMSGSPLAFAWAGEAAVLAWLARRVKDIRYQLWALLYFAAALIHVLALDAPPPHLFKPLETSAGGALAVVAVGAAAAAIAFFTARRRIVLDEPGGFFFLLAPVHARLAAAQRPLRFVGYWLAGVSAVYALSLGVLVAVPSFDWGHVTMYALWSAVGLGLCVVGLRRPAGQLRVGGLVWLAATMAATIANGEAELSVGPRSVAFFVVGAALLAAALLDQLLPRPRGLGPVAFGFVIASVGMGLAAFSALVGGSIGGVDERGLGFLGLAVLYGALSAAVFRINGQRDLSTLLWGTALVLAYGASERLLPGTFHALTLAVAAVALAWIASRLREPRFLTAAAVVLLVGVATVVFRLAPPTHMFQSQLHPGNGALAALLVAVAAACVAALAGKRNELLRRGHDLGWWVAGVLAVYGLSLFLLELFQRAFPGSTVQTNFQRGHTAVSAFWVLIGLAALYYGLTRLGALRVAGFALFGVSLAKIFLYDLPSLSSVTRALSFLAVGAVLLLGGFFYQRLASRQPARPARARPRPRQRLRPEIRPLLAVALVVLAALIVWFGTGSEPLGKPRADVSSGHVHSRAT